MNPRRQLNQAERDARSSARFATFVLMTLVAVLGAVILAIGYEAFR